MILVYNHTLLSSGSEQPQNYSWIGHWWEVGFTLAFRLSVSDSNPESRFGILTRHYTHHYHWILDKMRIDVSDLFVSTLCCKCFPFDFDVLHQIYYGVDVVSRQVGPRWWQLRTFWKAQKQPVHVQPSWACWEVVNMLHKSVFRDSLHGVALVWNDKTMWFYFTLGRNNIQ